MGGKQCQLQNFSLKKLQDSELVEEISDPLAGRLKVFRILRPPYDYVVEHQIFVQQQDIQKIIGKIQKWGEHLITGLSGQSEGSCGRMSQLSFYFQYYKYTLLDAVRDYKCKQRFFEQDQLIYIVTAVCHVLLTLKQHNIIHASINSESILLDLRKLPKLKLSHLLHEFNISQLKKLMSRAFYSPEERVQNRLIDYLKCDIFSLGICALEAMTLIDAKTFYEYNKPNIAAIKQALLKHKHIYPKLCVLISGMLETDPKKRFSLEKIIELAEGPHTEQQDQTLEEIEQPRKQGKKIKTVRPLNQVC